ncbi:MAG TPA: UDP-N-acetylmuramoyl-L-alanine--D-glutamate ligase [Verrucomicrobiae bacterium]|nr:UDP-N-acetylmuramoyl-L-alanine--D-glutamate ligase [Verrucomicrobiae bacterium]
MQTMELKGKDVLVLGLGRSGMAAASLLQRDGARVVVRDESADDQLRERASRLRQLGVRVELGNEFDRSTRFDLAVLSPGIAPERPIVRELLTQNTPLLSELELAYRFCLCPIVAITGTNGKTTTTELIARVLEGCGKRTLAAGNIGTAFSDAVEASAGLDTVVLEVSSFQLEKIEHFRADIAVLLNITPDHLDRYDSMEEYAAAKSFVFMNQRPEDTAIVSAETLEMLRRMGLATRARTMTFSAYNRPADVWLDWFDNDTIWCRLPECRGILLKMSETNLRGVHNAENVLATLATGLVMGLPVSRMREAICTYSPQPHRCEFVAEIDGVTYINDSKATNVDAVEKALRSVRGRAVLIAGGRDKSLDFSQLKEVMAEKVKLAVLIGEAQNKMWRAWSRAVSCVRASSMEQAVDAAVRRARAGDTVLLSPACASFDMFENYEARGDEFKRQVFSLQRRNGNHRNGLRESKQSTITA